MIKWMMMMWPSQGFPQRKYFDCSRDDELHFLFLMPTLQSVVPPLGECNMVVLVLDAESLSGAPWLCDRTMLGSYMMIPLQLEASGGCDRTTAANEGMNGSRKHGHCRAPETNQERLQTTEERGKQREQKWRFIYMYMSVWVITQMRDVENTVNDV